MIGTLLTLLLAVGQSPGDSIYGLALRLPEAALVSVAKTRPQVVRDGISSAMARTIRTAAGESAALAIARRLAVAFQVGWSDSFLIREVERFSRASPPWRRAKVHADSLRRAGVAAFSRDGPARAIGAWRLALSRYRALRDTAGIGAVMDNIGAALTRLGRADSAKIWFEQAQPLAAAAGDVRLEANILGHLADLHAGAGELAAARDGYTRASRLREQVGDTRGIAADRNNLGLIARDLGDLPEARRHFEAALGLNRSEGRPELAATNLVNLAALASLEGALARARTHYQDALATWRNRGDLINAAVALVGLGQLDLRRADYPAARDGLREALEIYQRADLTAEAIDVSRALANALTAAGDLQGAIDELARADRAARHAGIRSSARGELALAQADLAFRLNALPQADERYRDAARWFTRAGADGRLGDAHHGLGLIALARDDTAGAERLLATAIRRQRTSGNARGAAITGLTLARIRWHRGDTAKARRELAGIAGPLLRAGDTIAAAEALGERASLEADAGSAVAAERYYRQALRWLKGRVAPETAWRLRAGLGAALASQDAVDEAARELRAAIDVLEGPIGSFALPERRSAFLADKWDTFARLAFIEHDRGLPAAAFEVSERLHAREMLELLARGRVASPPAGPQDLLAREQDLRRRLAEMSTGLIAAPRRKEWSRGPDLSDLDGPTRASLLRTQSEYADLLLQIRERAPRQAAFVAPRVASWREVARRLDPDQALVGYLLGDSTSIAFVVVRDSFATVNLDVSRRELVRLVEFGRESLERVRSDSLWRSPFRRLDSFLFAAVEATTLLAGKTRLVLVPHAELHYLPFAALLGGPRGDRLLVERYQVTLAPSASVWLALGDRPPSRSDGGVLAVAPRPDALPASRLEVAQLERFTGPPVQTRIGSTATEELFRREAGGRRIIHLASYGVLNKQNPLFSFVELAAGGGHDGRLEVHEVFGLDLAADLVVLSACQTGLGSGTLADVPAGDDWVGLTRAFLQAGARQVLATLWPVNDWATAALMERFYRALARSGDAAAALTEAQRLTAAEAATADPFNWAGFVLVGGAEPRGTAAAAKRY